MDWTARALSNVEFDDNVLMDKQAEQISHKMEIMNYAIDAKKMLLLLLIFYCCIFICIYQML